MGKSSPKTPSASETAAASTAQNVSTAVANAYLQNVNQNTPYGTLSYDKTGNYQFTDPNSGSTYDIPTFTATQTLNQNGQQIQGLLQGALGNVGGAISQPVDMTGAPTVSPLSYSWPELRDWQETRLPSSGPIATSVGDGTSSQSLNSTFGAAPDVTQSFGAAPDVTQSFGAAPDVTQTYGTDFSEDRQRVEDALMQRLQTQINRDRETQQSRLANQGIRLGSNAYSASEDDFNRGVTDARLGVILAGGEEQSRLAGLEAQRAAFQNTAQQQIYDQALGRGTFANNAQQQIYDQALGRGSFSNAAQQQIYDQALGRGTFANNALESQFGVDLQRAAFQNAAQQQQFDQNLQSVGLANQANQQMFTNQIAQRDAYNNLQVSEYDAQVNARNQYLQEQFALRNQPLNEMSALLSGGQVSQPSFFNTSVGGIPTTDIAGITNAATQSAQASAASRNAFNSSLLGGLFGLGSAGIIASDRRLKEDVREIGKTKDGQPLYSYRYKGSSTPQIGLMAQDVEKRDPEAVIEGPGGIKMVDYPRALGSILKA